MPQPVKESDTVDFEKSAKVVNGRGVLKEGQSLETYGSKGDTVHTGYPDGDYDKVEGAGSKRLPDSIMVRWEGKTYKGKLSFNDQENGATVPVYEWETRYPVY